MLRFRDLQLLSERFSGLERQRKATVLPRFRPSGPKVGHDLKESYRMIRHIAAAAALALVNLPLHATTYTFEARHTEGVVRWSHLGFANPTAQFSQVVGTLTFDAADPTRASVTATITLANMTSGVPDLDDNFHSTDFFDTAKFPTATFTSTKVARGEAPHKFVVTGNLTVHGVTRPVTLDVTLNKIGLDVRNNLPSIGFDATTTLKRSDFGLGLYVPQVSDDVSVHLTVQADEAKGYAKLLRADADAAAADAKAAAQRAARAEAAAKQ
jgi:polyisoprenoid-binding protein YceI